MSSYNELGTTKRVCKGVARCELQDYLGWMPSKVILMTEWVVAMQVGQVLRVGYRQASLCSNCALEHLEKGLLSHR